MPHGSRRVENVHPAARRELNALNASLDRADLPLNLQMQAAEGLVRKARARGASLTLSQAMSDIANAQLMKQRNRSSRRGR